MTTLHVLIPFISAILFRLGGWGQWPFLWLPWANPKLWRWIGIGLLISVIFGTLWPLIAYFIATNVFSYGDNHPLTKLFGRFNWFISGFMFGLASLAVLTPLLALLQGLLGGVSFYALMKLSNDGIKYNTGITWYLDHKYVEIIGGGLCGTLLYLFA